MSTEREEMAMTTEHKKIKNKKMVGTETVIKIVDNAKNPIRLFFTEICPGVRVKSTLANGQVVSGFVAAICSSKGQTGHSSLILESQDGTKQILNWRLGYIKPTSYKIQKIQREGRSRIPVQAPFIPLGEIKGGVVASYEDDMEVVVTFDQSVEIKSIEIDKGW